MSLFALCSSVGVACTEPPPPAEPGGPSFVARQVELELPTPGGQLVARGARLTIGDGGAELTLEGDAAVELQHGDGIAARARRVRVRPADQQLELAGGVRARIEIGGARDGGP